MGLERPHLKVLSQLLSLEVTEFGLASIGAIAARGNVPEEAESLRFVSAFPTLSGGVESAVSEPVGFFEPSGQQKSFAQRNGEAVLGSRFTWIKLGRDPLEQRRTFGKAAIEDIRHPKL